MKAGGGNAKGKRFERELAAILKPHFPEARRGFQFRGGKEVADVDGTPGFRFEAKCGRRTNPRAALAQAIAEKREDEIAVAVCKDDRCEPIAVMRLEDLLTLIARSKLLHDDDEAPVAVPKSLTGEPSPDSPEWESFVKRVEKA